MDSAPSAVKEQNMEDWAEVWLEARSMFGLLRNCEAYAANEVAIAEA